MNSLWLVMEFAVADIKHRSVLFVTAFQLEEDVCPAEALPVISLMPTLFPWGLNSVTALVFWNVINPDWSS